jgi:hypothetical protein
LEPWNPWIRRSDREYNELQEASAVVRNDAASEPNI